MDGEKLLHGDLLKLLSQTLIWATFCFMMERQMLLHEQPSMPALFGDCEVCAEASQTI
jgi:hypothetical protein